MSAIGSATSPQTRQEAVDAFFRANNGVLTAFLSLATSVTMLATFIIACLGCAGVGSQLTLGATMAGFSGGGLLANGINVLYARSRGSHSIQAITDREVRREIEAGMATNAIVIYCMMVHEVIFSLLGALAATGVISATTMGWIYIGPPLAVPLLMTVGFCCVGCCGYAFKRATGIPFAEFLRKIRQTI